MLGNAGETAQQSAADIAHVGRALADQGVLQPLKHRNVIIVDGLDAFCGAHAGLNGIARLFVHRLVDQDLKMGGKNGDLLFIAQRVKMRVERFQLSLSGGYSAFVGDEFFLRCTGARAGHVEGIALVMIHFTDHDAGRTDDAMIFHNAASFLTEIIC